MFDTIIGYGLSAMVLGAVAMMAVFMVVLPAVDIAREIIREAKGR